MKEGVLLKDLQEDEEGKIVSIEGGRGVVQRLNDMGLTPGTEIKVIKSGSFHGPIEICVRQSYLVIGRGIAAKILVKRK